jgi:hypothetical protein
MDSHNVITVKVGGRSLSGVWTVVGARLVVATPLGDIRTILRDPSAEIEPIARRLLQQLAQDSNALSH